MPEQEHQKRSGKQLTADTGADLPVIPTAAGRLLVTADGPRDDEDWDRDEHTKRGRQPVELAIGVRDLESQWIRSVACRPCLHLLRTSFAPLAQRPAGRRLRQGT